MVQIQPTIHSNIYLAEVLGFEPRLTESKSVVLPLHYTPTKIKQDAVA